MTISVGMGATRSTTLKAAILSILRQTWSDWELIVIGQGEDRSICTVTEEAAGGDGRVRYVHIPERGLSRARNAVIGAALGEVIAFTDDDCEAHPEWLATIAAAFAAEPGVGVVTGAVLAPEPEHRLATCPEVLVKDVLYDPAARGDDPPDGWGLMGANFALHRSVIDCVGLFDEHLGPGVPFAAGDDIDYMLRLVAHRVKMRATPRSIVYHTYGTRYGWRVLLRHQRAYARGEGGLAAKRTLMGEPRDWKWLRMRVWQDVSDCLRRRPYYLPFTLRRMWYYTRAYQQCLHRYRVDPERSVLQPLSDPS